MLSSKFVISALLVCGLIVTVCLLWSWQGHRELSEQEAKHAQFLQRITSQKTAPTVQVTGQTETESEPFPDRERLEDTAKEGLPETETFLAATDTGSVERVSSRGEPVVKNASTEAVRISPFGFGPYPEVPEGCPVPRNLWNVSDAQLELLFRVAIQKWNEGERFNGCSTGEGKVYLHYPNTVYIQYGEPAVNDDGTITRPITHVISANIGLSPQQMRAGDIPAGIHVLEYGKDGIAPYEYLDLPYQPEKEF